ncbi:MAG: sugar phosphate nucleotidyltransferase [Solirubrobacterales bacterium]
MQALILAGGEGTRLRPLTQTIPKPAIQLVDRPFLRFVIDWLASHGVDEVIVASGFGADELRAALGEGGSGGPSIAYITEHEPLGTGGPLRLAADQGALAERFLVLNGDVLTDLDLGELIRAHEECGAVATLALHRVDDPTAYGLVRRTGGPEMPGAPAAIPSGEVLEFLEKPEPDAIDTDEISAGAYVLERQVIDLIPGGRNVSIEREVFPRLVGHGLYGHGLRGYWMDIGTPERYLQASWDILEGRVKTDVRVDRAGVLVETEVALAADASIGPRAVIARGTQVGEGASVSSSVVLPNGRIGAAAHVTESILAPGARIGDGAKVGPGVVLGEGSQVEPGARIDAGARIPPGGHAS